jgi:hypothetical protein
MKTVKELTLPLLSAAAVILAGCVVTSVYPFYYEKDVAFESALVGDWKNTEQPDEHWRFERAGGNGYRITGESGGKTSVLQGHLFKLHGQTFLDLTTAGWKEDIQPEPVSSHLLVHIAQLTPTVKLLPMNYGWLKDLLAKDPNAIRHLVIRTGERPEDRRIVLTADTAELQRFVVKHLKTEGAWETGVELKSEPAGSASR